MNRKFWKPFRVIVSLIVFISILFLFIDFRQLLPSHWYDVITYFQFVPSILKFIGWAGILSLGFAIVLLSTILWGRVYCSTICPLGILQDTLTFVSGKFRKKFKFKYSKPHNVWRYSIFGLTVIPLLFGSITILYLLDPYSNFGRIASDLGRPIFMLLNNLLVKIFINFKIYWLSPFDISKFDWIAVVFPVFILGVIVWMSVTRGRLYCNTVCPVGTFLGLLSNFSIFKIKIDQHSCTQCAKCAFVCKSQCINIKERTVDHSRCVGCFNCLSTCDKGGISYKLTYTSQKKKEPKASDESKRSFIAGSVLLAGAIIGISKSSKAQEKLAQSGGQKTVTKKNHCTPPGSDNIEHFKQACTACHLCVSACHAGVLQPSLFQYGWTGMLQPFMDYSSGFCNFECTKCGEVCPTGAIKPLTKEEKKTCQIGKAQFVWEYCIVYTKETSCGSCSEHCPTQAVRMVAYKNGLTIPEVTTETCIGCGACEHVCPVKTTKAIYVEGSLIQQKAKKPEFKKLENKQLEEFPF